MPSNKRGGIGDRIRKKWSLENQKYIFYYQGIDRKDNLKGYSKENCVSCCKRCNRAKDVHNQASFLEWIKLVYNKNIKDKNGI